MNKLGYFFIAILVLLSLLLLQSTQNRKPDSAEQPQTETTVQTDPAETTPETSAVPETTLSGATQQEGSRVEQILEEQELNQTAVSHWVFDGTLNYGEGTAGCARTSHAYELAVLSAEQEMNPVAAFWTLVEKDVYRMESDQSGVLSSVAFVVPKQDAVQYPYTDEGARCLLTDLLELASRVGDGLELEQRLLGADGAVEADQVFLASAEGCRYGYFIAGGERSIHFLCFYLRSDDRGEWITDVEFQLLNLRSAVGDSDGLALLDRRGDDQAAVLMAAAELLMTGTTKANQGNIPFSRQETGYSAEVERFGFTAGEETGALINYRLKPTK